VDRLAAIPALLCTLDAEGNVRGVSDQLLARLGADRGAVVGAPFAQWVPPTRVAAWQDALARLGDRAAAGLRLTLQVGDGHPVPFAIEGQAEGAGPDRRIHLALTEHTSGERLQAQLDAVFEAVPEAMIMVDADRRIVVTNPAFEDVFGFTLDDVRGQTTRVLYEDEDSYAGRGRQVYNRGSSAGVTRYVERYRRASGEAFLGETTGAVITDDGGQVLGYLGLIRDVTMDLDQAHALEAANAQLKESNEDLAQFAAVVSHDLQAPLRQVTAFCELLEGRNGASLEPESRTWLRGAITASNRMRRLIRDLLAYSRVGHEDEPPTSVDTDHVLYEVLSDLTTAISDADATITAERLPIVTARRLHVRQLLQNLIANALAHRGDHPPHIRVRARHEGDAWRFDIADNGPGIAPEQQARIFEVFSRLHPRRGTDGTGIGLAICRRIIGHAGGRIWVDSVPGGGSTFHFTLPTAPGRARRSGPQPLPGGQPPPVAGAQSAQADSQPPADSTDSRNPA
jgi:PAS domain S-box-containing protein